LALLKLKECVNTAKSPSPPGETPPAAHGNSGEDLRNAIDDARPAIKKLLQGSGLSDVVLIAPRDSPYDFADIAWKAENVQGFAQFSLADQDGVEKTMIRVIGSLALGCGGVFCSQSSETPTEGNSTVRQFHAGCSLEDLNVFSAFTVFELHGLSVLIGNNTLVDFDTIKKLNRNLREAILKELNGK
jgi:hypothetical protein